MMVKKIIHIVCKYYDITEESFHSRKRYRELVQARQIAMYFARKYTKLSTVEIGMFIGNRDHATVIYAVNTINNLLDIDNSVIKDVNNIEMLLNPVKYYNATDIAEFHGLFE